MHFSHDARILVTAVLHEVAHTNEEAALHTTVGDICIV